MDEQQIIVNLANNLENLRTQRNLTQTSLAKICGIPRSTITNLESGYANPTLTLLSKLATALKLNIEELITSPRAICQIIKAGMVPKEERSGGKVKMFKLLPDAIRGMEIDRLELSANSRLKGVPHIAHTKEYLTCIKGEIEVHTSGDRYLISVGDVLAFPGDRPHSYFNPSRHTSICLSVVALAF